MSRRSSVVEVEKAVELANEDKAAVPSLEDARDVIGKLIEESRPKEDTDSPIESTGDKVADGKRTENDKEGESEQISKEEPSERVKEAQCYNNRDRGSRGRGRGRGNDRPYQDRYNRKNNIKSELTSQQESSDPAAIRKQVEFYFSDSNLLQDKFLFTKIEGHKNVPVPISVIHSFKRMRHFQPISAIVEALKESAHLNVVDDDTSIQRKEALPEGLEGKPMVEIEKVYEDKSMAQSVYVKGFGIEQPSTQFDIEAFFAQYGPTNSVRLRRTYDATFKGSVFVEFDSEKTQQDFLSLDPAPKWQGNELQIKSKKQYCDEKVDDIAAGKVRPNENGQAHNKTRDLGDRKRRRDSPNHDRGKTDDKDERDWRQRRDEDAKAGFKDHRNGKHKNASGRGRGGGRRAGRGGRNQSRDRNDEAERQNKEHEVPEIATSTADVINEDVSNAPSETAAEEDRTVDIGTEMGPPAAADSGKEYPSKKRTREEEDGVTGQGSAKKVDTKE